MIDALLDPPEVTGPACSHCGIDEPEHDGVCTFCLFKLGAAWMKCHSCGKPCTTAWLPEGFEHSKCCGATFHRCDADAGELAKLSREAAEEGDADTAELLLRLAIRERARERKAFKPYSTVSV